MRPSAKKTLRQKREAQKLARQKSMAQKAYQIREKRLKEAAPNRIINNTIGEHRIFAGTVIFRDRLEARRCKDTDLLSGIKDQYSTGKAIAYWTDGSLKHSNADTRAILGAGVVHQARNKLGKSKWKIYSYELGEATGSSSDAELFGVAAALGLAVERVLRSEAGSVERVRVFTDNRLNLEAIEAGTIRLFGPAVSAPWALQNIYDHVDFLVERGVRVELVWLKAHALSEGNIKADQAAFGAVQKQLHSSARESGFKRKETVPAEIAKMGQNSIEERYWRVNSWYLLEGKEGDEEKELELEGAKSEGSADMNCSD